ncbi:CoA transferase subunit A [Myxococcota bacterium]|nr:CoA transferase subunit A [Myxococcota bacterium]MBU1382792.1 CoA transferase subunit A [Myxococcota bacterium]MBU1495938.1 CoA transferase subunit A [Myxococcota bacterium]
MPRIISGKEAAAMISSGDRIMVAGFLVSGCPEYLMDCLYERDIDNLHLIAISTDYDDRGIGRLISKPHVKTLQVSHIGTNRTTQTRYKAGEIDIEFVPQGILMERIRAAGAGLGGIFSPVGVGTVIAEGKQTLEENGRTYILEKPIHGKYSLIRAKKADKLGNLVYNKMARNSNTVMAMGADITIVEVDEIVEVGELSPEEVVTPGIFVDYIVKKGE